MHILDIGVPQYSPTGLDDLRCPEATWKLVATWNNVSSRPGRPMMSTMIHGLESPLES